MHSAPTRLATAVLVLAVATTAAWSQKGWLTFTSPEKDFSVRMPFAPKSQSQDISTPLGIIKARMFLCEASPAYVVCCSDYPAEKMQATDPQQVLDGAARGVKGKLLARKAIQLGSHPGRDLEFAAGDLRIRNRLYLVGNRLYQVQVVYPAVGNYRADVERFVTSFRLLRSHSFRASPPGVVQWPRDPVSTRWQRPTATASGHRRRASCRGLATRSRPDGGPRLRPGG